MAIDVSIKSIVSRFAKTLFANSFGSILLSYLFANSGTNAALKAPSAKKRLKILGNLNAATNASNKGPAPMKVESKISLTIPRIRLSNVHEPTVITPFVRLTRIIVPPV